jgi:hypothetical protein
MFPVPQSPADTAVTFTSSFWNVVVWLANSFVLAKRNGPRNLRSLLDGDSALSFGPGMVTGDRPSHCSAHVQTHCQTSRWAPPIDRPKPIRERSEGDPPWLT